MRGAFVSATDKATGSQTASEILIEVLHPALDAILALNPSPVNEVRVKIEKPDGQYVLSFDGWAHCQRVASDSLEGLIEAVRTHDPEKAEVERRQRRIVELQTELTALRAKESK
jgi:hypothetical protein